MYSLSSKIFLSPPPGRCLTLAREPTRLPTSNLTFSSWIYIVGWQKWWDKNIKHVKDSVQCAGFSVGQKNEGLWCHLSFLAKDGVYFANFFGSRTRHSSSNQFVFRFLELMYSLNVRSVWLVK
jgi:hypothetical protein